MLARGPRGRVAPGRRGLPAAPLHAHRAAVARLRRRVRRRRRRRAHRRVPGRRGAAARRVGPAARCARCSTRIPTTRGHVPPAPRRRRRARARPRPAGRRRADPRRRRPHDGARRVARGDATRRSRRREHRRAAVDASRRALERAPARRASHATRRSPSSRTYRLGGPVAVVVRVGDDAGAARASPASSPRTGRRCSSSGAARTCWSPTPASPGVGDRARRRRSSAIDDRRRRRRVVRAGGAVAAARARAARRGGRARRARVLRRHPRLGRRRRAHERGRPRRARPRDVLAARAGCSTCAAGGRGRARRATPPGSTSSYRHSNVGRDRGRRRAPSFAGAPDDADACAARIDEIVRWRREHQPGGANAGSVFRNPPGDSAGRLIDAAGLQGAARRRRGRVREARQLLPGRARRDRRRRARLVRDASSGAWPTQPASSSSPSCG